MSEDFNSHQIFTYIYMQYNIIVTLLLFPLFAH